MKKMFKFSILVVVIMTLFTGCRTAPIHNYDSQVTVTSSVALDKVAKEIIAAGVGLGWEMKKVKDGEIVGTLFLRTHMAQVRIPYTTKSYQIIYKSSSNLKYDAKEHTIHSNYNGWVQNLNNAIQVRLGML